MSGPICCGRYFATLHTFIFTCKNKMNSSALDLQTARFPYAAGGSLGQPGASEGRRQTRAVCHPSAPPPPPPPPPQLLMSAVPGSVKSTRLLRSLSRRRTDQICRFWPAKRPHSSSGAGTQIRWQRSTRSDLAVL